MMKSSKKNILKPMKKGFSQKPKSIPFCAEAEKSNVKKYNLELMGEKTNTDRLCNYLNIQGCLVLHIPKISLLMPTN